MTDPRLRFDKVVLRLMADLQRALDADIPAGTTLLVTCTAPIRVPGQSATAIAERARLLLAGGSTRTVHITVHGNDVRLRVVPHNLTRAPKVLGFVHNPEPRPGRMLDAAAHWLDVLGRAAAAIPPAKAQPAKPGVLRVPAHQHFAFRAVNDHVCGQLLPAIPFTGIVLVDNEGRTTLCPSTSTRRSSNPAR